MLNFNNITYIRKQDFGFEKWPSLHEINLQQNYFFECSTLENIRKGITIYSDCFDITTDGSSLGSQSSEISTSSTNGNTAARGTVTDVPGFPGFTGSAPTTPANKSITPLEISTISQINENITDVKLSTDMPLTTSEIMVTNCSCLHPEGEKNKNTVFITILITVIVTLITCMLIIGTVLSCQRYVKHKMKITVNDNFYRMNDVEDIFSLNGVVLGQGESDLETESSV